MVIVIELLLNIKNKLYLNLNLIIGSEYNVRTGKNVEIRNGNPPKIHWWLGISFELRENGRTNKSRVIKYPSSMVYLDLNSISLGEGR